MLELLETMKNSYRYRDARRRPILHSEICVIHVCEIYQKIIRFIIKSIKEELVKIQRCTQAYPTFHVCVIYQKFYSLTN